MSFTFFEATEFEVHEEELRQTGRVETYTASTAEEAIAAFIYTRRLSDGNFNYKLGPTGKVIYCGSVGYTFTPVKPQPEERKLEPA